MSIITTAEFPLRTVPGMRDCLFLLAHGFADPNYPGQVFYCPESTQLEGLLAIYAELTEQIDVERVGFEHPRTSVVALVGRRNQTLPLLVLAPEGPEPPGVECVEGVRFVANLAAIAQALTERHGFPRAHP